MTINRFSNANPGNGRTSNDFQSMVERFFGLSQDNDQSNVVTSQWTPRVDIKEEKDRFLILADIPGVDPAEIEIHMDKGILTLKGERKVDAVDEADKFTRVERSRGLFHRRFALPDSANPEGISAVGKHGVLEIVIPKRPETTPRRISITAH